MPTEDSGDLQNLLHLPEPTQLCKAAAMCFFANFVQLFPILENSNLQFGYNPPQMGKIPYEHGTETKFYAD